MIEQELIDTIGDRLRDRVSPELSVQVLETLGGGSINTSLRIATNEGNFFVKYNDANAHPDMFRLEAENLNLLRQTKSVRIPEVIDTFAIEDKEVLVLEFIEAGTPHYDFWREFGQKLADLHQHSNNYFGLSFDNYVGSLPQQNTATGTWVEFFITYRLDPLLRMAVDNQKADSDVVKKFESLYLKLPELFPEEKPALLHGDLWSGNTMADLNGDAVIFDPAVYYGHREMDLAMSKLFGGFEYSFYEAYNEVYPLEKHWEQRVAICNLYPLLVHVNLFMGSYIQSVKNILNRY